jgi:hypothetical protein
MLSGLETDKDKVLRIILAGQPELNDKLNSQDLIQLTQRIRLRFHLTALSKTETIAYIDHRLEVAGSQGRRIFAEETYPTIYRYTGGVPRLINTLVRYLHDGRVRPEHGSCRYGFAAGRDPRIAMAEPAGIGSGPAFLHRRRGTRPRP